MFGRDELRATGEYAVALYEAATERAPWPPDIAARWTPFHQVLGAAHSPGPALEPISARIATGGAEVVLPPVPLALTEEALFPVAPHDHRGDRAWDDERQALRRLTAAIGESPPETALHAFEPLYFWMQRHATNLPATLGGRSLSLFRQFALSTALFAASDGEAPARSLTVVGSDTPGIQEFIGARLSSKGVAKGLRGRSIFLQLVTDAVARRLLDALHLPRANLLYAAGGNLLLLAPRGAEEQLLAIRREISAVLLEWSEGQIDQALAWVTLPSEMVARDVRPALRTLRQTLASVKRRPYGDLLSSGAGYDRLFRPDVAGSDAPRDDGYDDLADAMARQTSDGGLYLHRRRGSLLGHAPSWQRALHHLSGGWLYELSPAARPRGAPCDHLVDGINHPEHVPARATGFRFIGLTTPRDPDGSIREVGEIAKVTPAGRIGVLRMDVDSLGEIFGRELEPATLAAICTLSESLDRFFAGWLNVVCQHVERQRALAGSAPEGRGDLLYTIYSGGDDLFIVGAWDRLPVLADAIRADFARYCGQNPALRVSAGIAVDDAHFPIYQLAERAGDALDAAKALRHPTRARAKNALCFLDHVLPWEAYDQARPLVARLTSTEREPSALLGRLRDLALLDEEERRRFGLPRADPFGSGGAMVGRAKWRGLVAIRRAAEQYRDEDEELARLLREFEQQLMAGTMTPHLALVARWADLLWRKSDREGKA